jgi:hypothetical protein
VTAWKLALLVAIVAMSLGYAFYDRPEDKPVPQSIAIHSAPPDEVIIEAPHEAR